MQAPVLQSFQSCSLQSAASRAAFSRIFDPLGGPGPPKSAARSSRPACQTPPLHGAAHAELPLAVPACPACRLRAKPYWSTTNQRFPQDVEFATPPTRKPLFYPLSVLKPQGQMPPLPTESKTMGDPKIPWGAKTRFWEPPGKFQNRPRSPKIHFWGRTPYFLAVFFSSLFPDRLRDRFWVDFGRVRPLKIKLALRF